MVSVGLVGGKLIPKSELLLQFKKKKNEGGRNIFLVTLRIQVIILLRLVDMSCLIKLK